MQKAVNSNVNTMGNLEKEFLLDICFLKTEICTMHLVMRS